MTGEESRPIGTVSVNDQTLENIANIWWLCLHWSFTSHYLQAACLFRLTFKDRSEETEKEIKKRKALLIALDILVYLGHLIFFCWLEIVKDTRNWATIGCSALNTVLFCISLVSFLAMLHIQRRSSQLQRVGVQANSLVMKVYVVLWVAASVIFSVVTALAAIDANLYAELKEIDLD